MTIKEFRKLRGMTQRQLAEAAGIVQSQISKVENGQELRGRNWARLQHYSGGLLSPVSEYPEECVS